MSVSQVYCYRFSRKAGGHTFFTSEAHRCHTCGVLPGMKKAAFILMVLVAVSGGFYFYKVRTATPEPVVTTQPFSRGDIVDAVSATGTLEAVETVQVGTQVSGVVRELLADFNSIVRKGQVIARLDPQLIQTQIEQQAANVLRA